MAVDHYALCPCGSGKKLKFCCADLAGEIEKIHRMIDGDQPRAALRHVEQTLATHPGRASLLDLKAILELSLGEFDAARQTIEQFVSAHPNSATAHACHALSLSEQGRDSRAAAAALQRAFDLIDHEMPQRVFEAIGAVGQALLAAGHIVAAQAHLWFNAAIASEDDTRAREILVDLNHYSRLPLLLRDQLVLRSWPEGTPWRDEAEKATRLSSLGNWMKAVEVLDQLGQKYGAEPALVYNRALLGGWLADDRALVAGMHAYAQMDVPLDDAVEAEAVAQLLDTDLQEEELDYVRQVYDVADLDGILGRLASDRRVQSIEMPPANAADSDQPRPRQSCVLYDRPMPTSGVGLSRGDLPRLVGVIAIYGRQTDRGERLELMVDKGPAFEASTSALKEIVGNTLGNLVEEQLVDKVSPIELALDSRCYFPRDTPPEVRRRLLAEERHAAIVERWPDVPQRVLGGVTPRDASTDKNLRIALIAAVFILEQDGNSNRDQGALAELRATLGLPQPEQIDPADHDVRRLPLTRVPRLKLDSVSDDDLVHLYRRAVLVGAQLAILYLAQEVVRRPSLAGSIPPHEAYRLMIAAESDLDRALALIDEARQVTDAAGKSTAEWDLTELKLHLATGNDQRAKSALELVVQKHGHDPQVLEVVYQILHQAGIVMPAEAPLVSQDGLSPAAVGTATESAAGRIWTPDSDRPAGGKSPIWTPS
ncbi:MAG: hypothetical protein L0Z07_00910 [Planctomycetes bacterium]|nr:hypothetical protein [Planctomycetota bacterium]